MPLELRARAHFWLVFAALFLGAVIAPFAFAQNVTTVAGGFVGDGQTLPDSTVNFPGQIAFDAAGNLFIADQYNHRVRKVTPGGAVSTVVGTGTSGFAGDGAQATQAQLNAPWGLAFDAAGNMFISDRRNNRIRKVTPAGVISTVAGDGTTAVLNNPANIAVATDGTIYVSESSTHRVRKIVGGVVSLFAGIGTSGFAGDNGPATSAKLYSPSGLLTQSDGSVLIADTVNNRIRIVDSAGTITTWRSVTYPYELARDSGGVLFVSSDTGIFQDNGTGFTSIAGDPSEPWGFGGDGGLATLAKFNTPLGLALASDGRVFINDYYNQRIRVINSGIINTHLGPGRAAEGGAALGARVNYPSGVTFDAAGNMFVSERNLHRIRKITPAGVISTYAGTGFPGHSGDGGPASSAQFYDPRGLAVTAGGDLLVADWQNMAIRKISPAGVMSEIALNPMSQLPDQVAVDSSGNIFVSHRYGVSRIAAGTNTVANFAGGGSGPYIDGVQAVGAVVGRPGQIGFDASGNVYFADPTYHSVRKVAANGIISTVAGTPGVSGTSGDGGAATSASLLRPHSLYVKSNGDFIVGDDSGRLRQVVGGVIQTIAGTGTQGFNGDGAALATRFESPVAMVLDGSGNLTIADSFNNAIRKLPIATSGLPGLTISDVTIVEGNSGTKTASFTVSLTAASASPVTFSLATSNGTATAGSDYVALSLSNQSIAAGQTSMNFSVTINGDLVVEADETFNVTLSNVANAELFDSIGLGTITNDDTPPSLSINDVSVTEGDSGTKNMTFTVQLSGVAASPVQYNIRTEDDGTSQNDATPGSDYVDKSIVDTIATGSSSKTFTVVINGDTEFELNETIQVRVFGVTGATVSDDIGVGTITNDDVQAPLTISIADGTFNEGNSGTGSMMFQLSLNRPADATVSFTFQTSDGSAVAGSDYTATSVNWTIPAGEQFLSFSVPILGDTLVEPSETFNVSLVNVSGATVDDGLAIGTISNDDQPQDGASMKFEDAYVVEGQSGTKNVAVTVRLSEVPASQVWFVYSLINGTAQAGSDYLAPSSQEVFMAPGATVHTLLIPIVGDSSIEGNETFTIQVGSRMGAWLDDGEAVVTIVDDEGGPVLAQLSITDSFIVNEGNSGTKAMAFNIALSEASASPVTFDVATQDLSASAGSDYVAKSTQGVTIAAGATSASFTVDINGDATVEPEEMFLVSLGDAQGATIIDPQAVGIIANDDNAGGIPALSIADVSLAEGNSGTKQMTFTVSLSAPAASAVTYDIATANGAATAGSDYAASSLVGQSIPAGQTSKTFSITISGDTAGENDEWFAVNISNVAGASVANTQALGYILNDDAGTGTISIEDVQFTEGNSGTTEMTFAVNVSESIGGTVTFDVGTSNGSATAGSDYVGINLVGLTIPPGHSGKLFSVTINGDTAVEANETFNIALSNVVGAGVADGQAVGTILNDDGGGGGPTLSIADVSIAEGQSGTKLASFTVTLSAAQSGPVFFDIATADGSATAGSDYVAKTTAGMRMAAGATSKTFTVTINGDTTAEGDETFVVNVTNPVGATISDGQATGTISNDDSAGTTSLSIGDVTIVEGNSGSAFAVFTVTLSAPSASNVTFNAATSDGTATVANNDYVAQNWGLVIPAGSTTLGLQVPITGDTTVEPNEAFTINLSNVAGATVADGSATCTITNDDSAGTPALSIADVSISEGDSGAKTATFTVSLSASATSTVAFDIGTANGTAIAGSDFVASSLVGQTIEVGQSSKTFSVTINGDTTVEPNETFGVNVSNVAGATVSDGSAVGTITNDDFAVGPSFSIGDVSISEGNSGTKIATFTVTLSAAQTGPVYFDIATANGTATAGSDYVAKTTAGVRIAAGATSKSFTVTINGDTTSESDETFTVNLSNPVGATIADGQAVGTITNDDAVASPTLSIADASVTEGNAGTKVLTFTVSLSPAAAGAVTYNIATSNGTATSGSDYVAASLVGESISAGGTSKTFAVTINGDTSTEADETFTVTLSNVVGATLGDGSAVGAITNDDGGAGPTLSIGDVSLAEGNGVSKQMTFTVSLSAAATGPVTYAIATSNGTAIAPGDYTTKSLTGQTIAAGATSKVFTVAIRGDTVVEPNETFTVTVSAVNGATVADGSATGTISNDDAATITVARFDARGLVDDIDDGNREPVISTSEYASLLLDTAKGVCSHTNAATIVGVDAVESLSVLKDLADATNATCAHSRYQAVMGEGSGFLVEASSDTDARGVQVISPPTRDAKTRLILLQVLGSGHAGPITVLLPQALSAKPAERTMQLRSLGAHVNAMLEADAEARIILVGGVTVPGLLDLTARSLPAKSTLPSERMLISPVLLQEFGKSQVEFIPPVTTGSAAQVLRVQP